MPRADRRKMQRRRAMTEGQCCSHFLQDLQAPVTPDLKLSFRVNPRVACNGNRKAALPGARRYRHQNNFSASNVRIDQQLNVRCASNL
jgi:hypothetical protein